MSKPPESVGDQVRPMLLYNDECGVCRRIAHWVQRSQSHAEIPGLSIQPIGDDPAACRALNPNLDIWDAYATIHLLMPDGSMKLGGEAVADVLRALPNTSWFAGMFNLSIWGVRPFQTMLDIAYEILADVRPLFGCESCGPPSRWWKPVTWTIKSVKAIFGDRRAVRPHFARHGTPTKARS